MTSLLPGVRENTISPRPVQKVNPFDIISKYNLPKANANYGHDQVKPQTEAEEEEESEYEEESE